LPSPFDVNIETEIDMDRISGERRKVSSISLAWHRHTRGKAREPDFAPTCLKSSLVSGFMTATLPLFHRPHFIEQIVM
jgi:hypothetical protein